MSLIERFEKMLENGQDNVLARFTLGSEYLKQGNHQQAIGHLRKALEFDPEYSVAWKLLGKALTAAGSEEEARASYRQGLVVAERRGDLQAVKEMRVFLKRLEKNDPA
jgi:Tfp pilus assembly protein PilF